MTGGFRRLRLIPWLRSFFAGLTTAFLECSNQWRGNYPRLSDGARWASWGTWLQWIRLENLELRLRFKRRRNASAEAKG